MNILRAILLGLDDEDAFRTALMAKVTLLGASQDARQQDLLAALNLLQQKVNIMSSTTTDLDTSIATLIADNAALKALILSAPSQIATLVATVVATQVGLGVTPTQLQSLADLHTALGGEMTELEQSLAGTAPAPPVVTPPVVTTPAPPTVDPTTGLPIAVVTPPGGTPATGTVDPTTGLPVA